MSKRSGKGRDKSFPGKDKGRKQVDSVSEYSALITNRENLYRFLVRIYKVEVDQALLDRMKAMCFPVECGEAELAEGYRILENYLQTPALDPLTDLAVDYAKVFLGAGIVDEREAAYPFESVYTSTQRMMMQDARDKVLAIYRAKGLDKAEALDYPEDHIALELEFMAHLCEEAKHAVAAQNWTAVEDCLQEQKDFLAQHLLNWVPEFCADIEKCAETEFYKAAGKITNGYLRLEQAILEDLATEVGATA
jgi:putative dimethyl sulfoxide reductase chaperone